MLIKKNTKKTSAILKDLFQINYSKLLDVHHFAMNEGDRAFLSFLVKP